MIWSSLVLSPAGPLLMAAGYQVGSGWRPDLISFLIGLTAGILLALAVYRLLPSLLATRERVTTRVRETQSWVRTGIEERYQVEAAEYAQQFHLAGRQAKLADIFVEPKLLAPQPGVNSETPWTAGLGLLPYLWPDMASSVAMPPAPTASMRQLLLRGRRVVISAEAGAGKSTLLAYCLYVCATATDTGPYTFLLPSLPVLIHFAELELDGIPAGQSPAGPGLDVVEPLVRVLQRRVSPLTSRGLADLLRRKMAEGRVLLLLDGLDELSAERRQKAVAWLNRLLERHPRIQVIAAGPLRGYGPLLDMGFVVAGLARWRSGEAAAYGARWSQIDGAEEVPDLHEYWRPGNLTLETVLRLQLAGAGDRTGTDNSERWLDLLELNLRQRLPSPDSEIDPPWLAPVVRDLWQQVAYQLAADGRLFLPETQVTTIIESILADYDVPVERDSTRLVYDNLAASDLFLVWQDRGIAFLNPVWRDYLATSYIVQQQLDQEILEHVRDPGWRQILRFYAGRANVDKPAALLLEQGGADPFSDGLIQLASWLPESVDGGQWRRSSLIRLGQLVVNSRLPIVIRQRAAIALANSGEPGVQALLRQLLTSNDPDLRQVAVASLARLEPRKAVDMILQALEDTEAGVRRVAVHALAWMRTREAEQALLEVLIGQDEPSYRASAEVLALNGDNEAFEILREASEEQALHVRRAAVHGLAMLDQLWSVELLDRIEREDDQWLVKSAAGSALEEIVARNKPGTWKVKKPDELEWLIEWAAAKGRAVPAGEAALPVLLEALTGAWEVEIRSAAAASLGQMARRDTVEKLHTMLKDPKAEIREAAFAALYQIGRAWDTNPFESTRPKEPEQVGDGT